jgi:hypothetical protein
MESHDCNGPDAIATIGTNIANRNQIRNALMLVEITLADIELTV